jgi:hypothetical protein
VIQLLQEMVTREDAIGLLDQAADEFDRRAMLPTICSGFEQARVMACAQWLRDMAQELRDNSES